MKKINEYLGMDTVTRQELVNLFVFARKHGKTPEDIKSIANSFGYKSRTQIKRKDINAIKTQLIDT